MNPVPSPIAILEKQTCLLCYQDVEYFAIGKCNHRDVCHLCNFRMRSLMGDLTCPFCKVVCESVVYTSNTDTKYEDNRRMGMNYDKHGVFYVEEAIKTQLEDMSKYRCQRCSMEFPNINQLKNHLKKHDLRYCDICLSHKKAFLSEQTLYTSKEYSEHMRFGKDMQKPHPRCLFCHQNYYGDDELFNHMQQSHYTCHICERNGHQYQYYKDYPALEGHFEKKHYMCNHAECLEKKFVVFSTEVDLKAHMMTHQSVTFSSRGRFLRISDDSLGFQYAPPPNRRRQAERASPQEQTHDPPNANDASGSGTSLEFCSPSTVSPDEFFIQSLQRFKTIEGFVPFGSLSPEETRSRTQLLSRNLQKISKNKECYQGFSAATSKMQNGSIGYAAYLQTFSKLFGEDALSYFLEVANLSQTPEVQFNLMKEYEIELKKRQEFPDLSAKPILSAVSSPWFSVTSSSVRQPASQSSMIDCHLCGNMVPRSEMAVHSRLHQMAATEIQAPGPNQLSYSRALKSKKISQTKETILSQSVPIDVNIQFPANSVRLPENSMWKARAVETGQDTQVKVVNAVSPIDKEGDFPSLSSLTNAKKPETTKAKQDSQSTSGKKGRNKREN